MILFHRLLIIYGTAASIAYGQLYLLAGSPTPDHDLDAYASALFRIEDGGVKLVAELVPQRLGTSWTGFSYDWRKAVLLPKYENRTLTVLDLDRAATAKKCELPEIPGKMRLQQWLGHPPARGPSFLWYSCSADVKDCVLQGMVLDSTVECDKSFAALTELEAGEIAAHGTPGISDLVSDGIPVFMNRQSGGLSALRIPLSYQVPAALRSGFPTQTEFALVNDSHVFVVSLAQSQRNYRLLAFRKSDKTWRVLPFSSEQFPRVRGFGRYIVAVEVQVETAEKTQSSGRAEWRKMPGKMGPTPHPRAGEIYPGRLYLYDVEMEQVLTITTNQGDSEVLLVADDTVYYRASDRLFAAKITSRGIGPARLVAKDDAVRDSHWAFIADRAN